MKKLFLFCLILLLTVPAVMADDDIEVFGLELEEVLNFGSALLAIVLFFLTVAAYKRSKRSKLLYISAAFLLFAVKGFLSSSELFFDEFALLDPITSLLDFVILLAFFFGILKK